MPEDLSFDVPPPAVKIEYLSGQDVLHHRVDREIAAEGGLFGAEKGIDEGLEIAVPPSGRAFGAGHGDIYTVSVHRIDAEADARLFHDRRAFKQPGQRFGRDAVNFYVDVGRKTRRSAALRPSSYQAGYRAT